MSITRVGDRYRVRVYVGLDPETGKKRIVDKIVSTEREARRLEAQLRQQVQDQTYHSSRKTMTEVLQLWLEKEVIPKCKFQTIRGYRHIVKMHLIPIIGNLPVTKLTPYHVSSLLAEKRAAGLSEQTCLHIYRALHRALEIAVRWGLVGRNVCDMVDPPKPGDVSMHILTEEEAQRLLQAARCEAADDGTQVPNRLYALYVTAILTGMRLGELLGLRWEDVNWETRTARVAQTLEKSGVRPRFGTPKNKRVRIVPLADAVIEALREWQEAQAQERALAVQRGREWAEYGLVFTQPNGRPLDGRSLVRWHFRRLKERAGVSLDIRFHDLRHTFVSRAFQAGANPRAVSEIVGHHDPGFTLRRYAHALLADMRDATQRLEERLVGTKGGDAEPSSPPHP